MKFFKYLAGTALMLLGTLIVLASFFVHCVILSFIPYILIEEKRIAGGHSPGYFEIIKFGFQYPPLWQYVIFALVVLILGILFGLRIGSIGVKLYKK